MAKKKQEKLFCVRAYCSKCHKLLMESNYFYKKDLLERWDACVIGATSIVCRECSPKAPNFNIDLKIYNRGTNTEYEPKELIPTNEQMAETITSLVSVVKESQEANYIKGFHEDAARMAEQLEQEMKQKKV